MSKDYDLYLNNHVDAVNKACKWIFDNCGKQKVKEILGGLGNDFNQKFTFHDSSKWMPEEYEPYDAYFYGPDGVNNENGPSEEVENAFNYAWLKHIHNNPHHWQHWVLINDDPTPGKESAVLEMPDRDILEMICDWLSFSWRKGDLYEMFNWWNEHSNHIMLGPKTKEKVIAMFNLILDKIDEVGGDVKL